MTNFFEQIKKVTTYVQKAKISLIFLRNFFVKEPNMILSKGQNLVC
jgi:hypothetical protein